MIRIPMANEKTARIELRSVAPMPTLLVLYTMLKTGFEGSGWEKNETTRDRVRFLPSYINDAIALFNSSKFIAEILGETASKSMRASNSWWQIVLLKSSAR